MTPNSKHRTTKKQNSLKDVKRFPKEQMENADLYRVSQKKTSLKFKTLFFNEN